MVPQTCRDCIKLGKNCVGSHLKFCTKSGWNSSTNTCEVINLCPQFVPQSCSECQRLGKDCIGSHAKACRNMGWDINSNQCQAVSFYNHLSIEKRPLIFRVGLPSSGSKYMSRLYQTRIRMRWKPCKILCQIRLGLKIKYMPICKSQ